MQSPIIHFGIDMLELYGKMQANIPFHLLQNEQILPITEDLAIQLVTNVTKYQYKIVFYDHFFGSKPPIFAFYKGQKENNSPVETKDYICFYSLAFRLRGESGVQKFLQKYFYIENKNPVKRLDICIDIKEKTEDFIKNIKELQQKKTLFYGEKGQIETFYIGEKQKTKNKRQLIRIYDKIKDLLSSGKNEKLKYYQKYLEYENITRIELELRRELTQNINFQKIFSKEYQKGLFKNYLGNYTKYFENFPEEKISLFRKKEKVDLYDIAPHLVKSRHFQSFLGYARTIAIGMNICPVKLLLGSNLYTIETYKQLQEKGIDQVLSEIQRSKHYQKFIIKHFENDKK